MTDVLPKIDRWNSEPLDVHTVNGGVKVGHWGGAKVGQLGASALERAALK